MTLRTLTSDVVVKFEKAVGIDFVTTNKVIRYSYLSKGIMGLDAILPDAVVRPKEVSEVQEVLQIADEHHIPVSPASGGLSGGFALPQTEPAGILLDLSRMDRVLEVDIDNRYVIVEPGVQTGKVWAYFRKNYPDWAPPVPDGAPPSATILGDAIERGFSLVTGAFGPQADLIMGLEVVLPNGDLFRTGSWALSEKGNGFKPFYRWGPGPNFDGLFLGSQGTMGVITKAAIRIIPHPHAKTIVAYGHSSFEAIQDATLNILKYEMGIADNLVMVQGGNWPLIMTRWPELKVPKDYDFYKKLNISEWWQNFEIWAHSDEELEFVKKRVAEEMEHYGDKTGNPPVEWKLHPKQIASRMKKPNLIAVPYALYRGGFLFITWYTPWNDSAEMSRYYSNKMVEYGFPPVIWVASIDHGRQAIVMPIVCFDSTDPTRVEQVRALDQVTSEYCYERGWLNYRPNPRIHSPLMWDRAPTYFKYLKAMKQILDPKGILHPGRLGF